MDEMFHARMITNDRAITDGMVPAPLALAKCVHMRKYVMGSRNLYRAKQDNQIKSLLSAEVSTQHVLHLSVHLSRCMQSDAGMQSCFFSEGE